MSASQIAFYTSEAAEYADDARYIGNTNGRTYSDDPLAALDSCALSQAYGRHQEVCRGVHGAEHCYRVCSGAAGRCAIRADGRRQILDLLLPGDFFGLFERHGNDHDSVVEAIVEETVLVRYPRRRVLSLMRGNDALAKRMSELAFAALLRSETLVLILGRTTAREKVGAFLVELSSRVQKLDPESFAIPISRYDIADYLGLSVETVSRSLSELRKS